MIDKTFDFKNFEKKYSFDDEAALRNKYGQPFMILLPPPNVTGSLHIGHSLCYTLQDILARYKRMRGMNVLFQPGMDHAGIVTQLLVEKNLAQKGVTKSDLGRENFINEIWKWKEESGGLILNQMKALGISCDFQKLCFTMDEKRQRAVSKFFVKLYNDGLIYKDCRLVNWDSKLKSAISDLEVIEKEEKGHLWHIKYKIENSNEFIIIATTRPETMFGDAAVAVHPEDERYKHLIGKNAILPISSRVIPIISDEYADPEKGSGAVKITPAHDFNDFEVGKRNNLQIINIMTESATLNENTPQDFIGMGILDARKKVIDVLKELSAIEKIDDITHKVPYSDRSGIVVEPFMTDQWFVDAKKLAGPAIEAVKSGEAQFTPKHWENLYFEWMNNIKPWCVSRQIWWGHRIPAWYGEDDKIFVYESESEANEAAKQYYGKEICLRRDDSVLDTWFSSALWPFTTLSWPDNTKDLKTFYSNAVVVTGFDIIFFWVARMMMASIYMFGKSPFKNIYIHGLVRDENGQKMSKSKGNVMDPIDLCEEYGADAVRFTLAYHCFPGKDIKMNASSVENGRNFLTKIWNAVRFSQMSGCCQNRDFDISNVKHPISKWIAYEVKNSVAEIEKAFDSYRFDEASREIYRLVWGIFCDWYLELVKPILDSNEEILLTTSWCLEQITNVLYPIAPFISSELHNEVSCNEINWPNIEIPNDFKNAADDMKFLMALITKIRSLKKELNIQQPQIIDLSCYTNDGIKKDLVKSNEEMIKRMSKINLIESSNIGVPIFVDGCVFNAFIGDFVDIESKIKKLSEKLEKLKKDMAVINIRLSNADFMNNASKEAIDEHTDRRDRIENDIKSTLELYNNLSNTISRC